VAAAVARPAKACAAASAAAPACVGTRALPAALSGGRISPDPASVRLGGWSVMPASFVTAAAKDKPINSITRDNRYYRA
jgi:hypothetical protein